MSELEEKLGSILSNPEMMQQIMGMAQMLSGDNAKKEEKKQEEASAQPTSGLDPGVIQAISGIARHSGTDPNQQLLLKALHPYLSKHKIRKLERAMNAARMAGAASSFLNSGGLQFLTSR